MSGAVESTLLVADPSLLSNYSPPVSKVERKESKMPSIKAERDDRNPSGRIPTLLLPWSLLGLIAVLAAAFHWNLPTISTTDDSWLRSLQKQGQAVFADHKTLLPLDSTDYLGLFCAVLGLMVAAGGGIGGGGILVPIYILVMGFSPKHAIPLSNVTVFGGAVANAVLNANKRHPLTDRPLVDWDLILVMEPLTIAGALMGAFLNKILPSELLVVMLVLLLAFTAYTTLETAIKMYKVETRQMRAMESELTKIVHDDEEEEVEQQAESLLEHMELQEGESPGDGSMTEIPFKGEGELAQILDEERVTPMANVHMVGVLFVVVLFINLMKGGGAFPSPLGIRCGSNSFWIANGLMFGWILVISFYARAYLVKRFETKRRVGYQYVEGDIQWDGRATIVYPALCAFAGFFAGMFGVGGGIVKGPLMLAMGVHPKVSSATSACMILFTSFTATTSFVVFGLLIWDYALISLIVGFLATFVGQIGLSYLMRKSQRNSLIAFSIGGVVLLSAFLMTIQSLVSLADKQSHHSSGGICGKGS